MTTSVRSAPLRVGLVGAGVIGPLRAQALRQVPALRLAAVADTVPGRAARIAGHGAGASSAAASGGEIRVYPDGVALLEDAGIDAIILCTPADTHEPLGVAGLAAGKHLLCEKPLATSVAGCQAMVGAAEKAGVCLATGFNLRYTRAARLARRLFDQGAIGALDHLRGFHGYPLAAELAASQREPQASRRGSQPGPMGGTLMDNGIHVIDLARWFLGDVCEVTGFATHHTWRIPGCEDNGFLLMRNRAGHVATLQASWTEWRGYGYRLEVYGTEGFLRFGYPPLYLTHGRRSPNGRMKIYRHLFPVYQVIERVKGWQWGLVETLVRDLEGWASAILRGEPAPITGLDGLEAVRIARSATSDDPR